MPIRLAARFLRDRSGNFAMLSALTMLPIIGAVGCGVDFIAASSERRVMQNAADSAVLAAAASPAGSEDGVVHDFLAAHLGSDTDVAEGGHGHAWAHAVAVANNVV